MIRRLSPMSLVLMLPLFALGACDEGTPTQPTEHANQAAAAAAGYSAQELNVPDIGEGGSTTSINAGGQVVGYRLRPDNIWRGFIWSNGVATDLGTLGGQNTLAFDINDNGQVVGGSQNPQGKLRAFRWVNGTMRNLGTLGGSVSRANAINTRGHVVGDSRLAGDARDSEGNPIRHAFLLKNGVMTDLGTLGGSNSSALDINDAGQIVGSSQTRSGLTHPFLWQNGVMKDLLPGSSSTGTAYAINSVGVVVGEKDLHAFRYSGGVLRSLPLGTQQSAAFGIRGGRIVGYVGKNAFVLAAGQVTLLPLLRGGEESFATSVNGTGVIVGSTTTFDSNVHPTRWLPQ